MMIADTVGSIRSASLHGEEMRFWLGTHQPQWLERTSVPLFIARQSLEHRMALPRAVGPWALDSGAFSEITMRGRWTVTPRQYVSMVYRFQREIGNMRWAAIQDWMCEPIALKKTGKSVQDHQRLTVENYLTLRDMAPDLPWAPVLQGWDADDYQDHVDLYDAYGVDLTALPIVGLGSVCRRSQTDDIVNLVRMLHGYGINLHGFGVKSQGLALCAPYLKSADSMAWSFGARVGRIRMRGCIGHINCANCIRYALSWRAGILQIITTAHGRVIGADQSHVVSRRRTVITK